jgi:hypothetical protein
MDRGVLNKKMVPLSTDNEKEECMFSTKAKSATVVLGVRLALSQPLSAQRTALTTGSSMSGDRFIKPVKNRVD